MSKLLKTIDQLAGAECSVLMKGSRPVGSTFPKEKIIYIKLALQSFGHIFKQVDRLNTSYDEAHIQLNNQRMVCFRLPEGFYISLLSKECEVQKAQKTIRLSRENLIQLLATYPNR